MDEQCKTDGEGSTPRQGRETVAYQTPQEGTMRDGQVDCPKQVSEHMVGSARGRTRFSWVSRKVLAERTQRIRGDPNGERIHGKELWNRHQRHQHTGETRAEDACQSPCCIHETIHRLQSVRILDDR